MKNKGKFTLAERDLVKRYYKSENYSLVDCYIRASKDKRNIEKDIRRLMVLEKGWGFRIISYNTYHFSCAYITGENGIEILNVFTPTTWGKQIPLQYVTEFGEIVERE